MHHGKYLVSLLLLPGLMSVIGCQSSDKARVPGQREKNLARTLYTIEDIESRRMDNMRRTLQDIDEAFSRDVARTQRHPELIRAYLEEELGREVDHAPPPPESDHQSQ